MRKCSYYFGNPAKHYTDLSLVLESYPVLEAALIDAKHSLLYFMSNTENYWTLYKLSARTKGVQDTVEL